MVIKNSSQQIANLLEEMITVRLEELIKSDWFLMLVEQTILKALREQKEKEKKLFKNKIKAVEAGAHGTLEYTIKEGENKDKIADQKILKKTD